MLSQLLTRAGRSSSPSIPFVASRTTPWHWHTRNWTTYTQTTNALTIHALNNISFPYIWLRDSCQSPECIHPNSKQKLHRSSDIPLNIAPTEEEGVKVTSSGIDITWNDGHKSSFDEEFLQRHASTSKLMEWHLDQHLTVEAWTRASLSNLPNLFIPYDKINTPSGLVEAITQLLKYGLLFVSGVPHQETSHDTCELRSLAERFGEIRQTFYGPVWDVVNGNSDNQNIAYTDLDLGLHMDLLYVFFLSLFPAVLPMSPVFHLFLIIIIGTSNTHPDTKYFTVSEIRLLAEHLYSSMLFMSLVHFGNPIQQTLTSSPNPRSHFTT